MNKNRNRITQAVKFYTLASIGAITGILLFIFQ